MDWSDAVIQTDVFPCYEDDMSINGGSILRYVRKSTKRRNLPKIYGDLDLLQYPDA